jgi:LuxR family maltose regulon positive regulatory protein
MSSDVIVRRRLLTVLREGVRGPLTLVTAPAGYGKTVLAGSWVAQGVDPHTVVYTTLDDDAAPPVDCWVSLLEGLHGAGVDVSGVKVAGSAAPVDPAVLGRVARRIAGHSSPVVWVLDCGEYALSPVIADGIHRLIARSGGGLSVLLLTRSDPPLPLHRYALDGALTEIRAADLSFTATEASTLMQRAGLHLSPADVDSLRVRTRGWPAGLRFAAMALAGRADTQEAIREFRGDTQNVAGYLMTEVLAKQPPAMREFLLRTCLVDELEPGIVAALTGQPSDPRALEFVAHGNAFVEPVPGRPGHYRYQPLFREFLRSQLTFEDPGLATALHREAAHWLAQDGQTLAGIRHATVAQAWPLAAHQFVAGLRYAGLLTGRQRRLLEVLFTGLPDDLSGPEAALTRAAFALAALEPRRATAELDAARTQLGDDEAWRPGGCATAIAVLEAVAASLEADPGTALEAAIVAERALQLVPAHDRVAHSELVAIAAGCKARALLQLGDLAAALAALNEGMHAAKDPHLAGVLSELMGLAALVEAMAGHLQRAAGMASRLLPLADGDGSDVASSPRAATLALAWVRIDEYDLPAAEGLMSSLRGTAPSLDARVLQKVEALLQARLFGAREEFDLAHAEVRALGGPTDPNPVTGWLDHLLLVSEAGLFRAQRRPREAVDTIQSTGGCEHVECAQALEHALLEAGESTAALPQLSSASIARHSLAVQVDSRLLHAERSIQGGEPALGETCLEAALQLAAPEHLRRPFLEGSEAVLSLLGGNSAGDDHRWLMSGFTYSDAPAFGAGSPGQRRADGTSSGPAPIVNPLTNKEREVLAYLADLLTTDEIAKTMFVSVNTVRSHVRSILRKLGVARRNEAVRRAWDLHLLPPRDAA